MRHGAVILHSEIHTDWSGEPIRVLEEARGMTERGYRVIIAAPRRSELLKRAAAAGLPVEPVFMKKWISYPYSLQKAVRILIRNKVNIVNTHASYDSWIFSIAAKLLDRRLIRTRHMSFLGSGWGTTFIYRLPDCIITSAGEAGRKEIQDRFGLKPGGVVSIPSGPNARQFDPDVVPEPASNFGIDAGDKVVGMVAAFRRGKGHSDLINSIPVILERIGSARFLFVGGGNLQLRDRMMNLTSSLGIADRCIFTGHRHDMPQIFSLMDLFVLPSHSEGTPQVIQQAMAMRLPVISCPVGGVPDLLGCSETPDTGDAEFRTTPHGILVPPGNPSILADAVLHLLERPELCREMGERNRSRVIEKYSSDVMLDKTEAVYRELLRKP
jgi:glycosyltransferase involved in cell wall biosynthesis